MFIHGWAVSRFLSIHSMISASQERFFRVPVAAFERGLCRKHMKRYRKRG
jgi:hypothetical protein